MKPIFSQFWNNESGATSIEYSLIAALIGVVIITGVTKLGTNLSAKFSGIADSVS
jgi:pilus assembly protein Flp/PilA